MLDQGPGQEGAPDDEFSEEAGDIEVEPSPQPASQASDAESHGHDAKSDPAPDDGLQQDSDAEDSAPAAHQARLPEGWDDSDNDEDDEEGFDVSVEDVDVPQVRQPYYGLLGRSAYWSLSKPAGERSLMLRSNCVRKWSFGNCVLIQRLRHTDSILQAKHSSKANLAVSLSMYSRYFAAHNCT